MKRFCSLAIACALLFTFGATRAHAQAMSGAMPAAAPTFDYQAAFLNDMKDLQTKFVGLAQAIPQDKYTWRPGEGVRSIAEVFLHVAGGNFSIPGMMGAKAPEGYNRNGYETSTTDKAAIIEQLNKSFAYVDGVVQSMSMADLTKAGRGFGGRPTTGYDTLFLITTDLHEHLGQQIAYARQNGVVPPWTAARQARGPVGAPVGAQATAK